MLITTDAIVLRSIRYGDTSRIVTLYTRELGKVGIMAKGARKPSGRSGVSRFGASLDVLSLCQVVFYFKEQRDLQLLSQADLIRQFRGVVDDPARLMAGCAMLELMNGSVQAGERHTELFDLLLVSLERLESWDEHHETGLSRFLLLLASNLGFGLDVQQCLQCNSPLASVAGGTCRFSTLEGGLFCARCSERPGVRISTDTAILLSRIGQAETPVPEIASAVRSETLEILLRHLTEHVSGIRTIRSLHLMHMFGD
jgi:DNA repair protein RecO (recombination protein O)